MIPKFIQLSSVTSVNRHEMISRVKEAISKGGGYITEIHMFSNAAVCINFEVSINSIGNFYTSLVSTSLRLDPESCDLLAGCSQKLKELEDGFKAADVMGTLNITFIHNEPDLRIKVPPIPG